MKYRVEIKKTEWLQYEIEAPSEFSARRSVVERGGAGAVPRRVKEMIDVLWIEQTPKYPFRVRVRVKR